MLILLRTSVSVDLDNDGVMGYGTGDRRDLFYENEKVDMPRA